MTRPTGPLVLECARWRWFLVRKWTLLASDRDEGATVSGDEVAQENAAVEVLYNVRALTAHEGLQLAASEDIVEDMEF